MSKSILKISWTPRIAFEWSFFSTTICIFLIKKSHHGGIHIAYLISYFIWFPDPLIEWGLTSQISKYIFVKTLQAEFSSKWIIGCVCFFQINKINEEKYFSIAYVSMSIEGIDRLEGMMCSSHRYMTPFLVNGQACSCILNWVLLKTSRPVTSTMPPSIHLPQALAALHCNIIIWTLIFYWYCIFLLLHGYYFSLLWMKWMN